MITRIFIPVAVLAATLTGCAKNGNQSMNTPPPNAMIADDAPINAHPISPDTRFAAGQLAEVRGDNEAAITQYKYVLAHNKNDTRVIYRLGCLYSLVGKYTDSLDMWHRYLKLTNDAANGYSNLAYTEELAGLPAEAEFDYKQGIKKDPTNEPCRINYGLMLARHGRMGEAVIQLQAVLPPAQVHFNLAEVYEITHRTEMAKIEYQESLALDPNFVDARDKLASLGDLIDEE
jgi:tetratricopeptide (TPR) repeat protein